MVFKQFQIQATLNSVLAWFIQRSTFANPEKGLFTFVLMKVTTITPCRRYRAKLQTLGLYVTEEVGVKSFY